MQQHLVEKLKGCPSFNIALLHGSVIVRRCLSCHIRNVTKHIFDSFLPTHCPNEDGECVGFCWEETQVVLQSNWILHCGTEEQPTACIYSTAGERKPCVVMQHGCCRCSSALTHTSTHHDLCSCQMLLHMVLPVHNNCFIVLTALQ